MKTLATFAATICVLAAPLAAVAAEKTVKVFILAGQSNMEGKAKVSLLETQVKQPGTRPLFAQFEKGRKWAERDDVWIKFLDRKGALTVGYGSPNCIGPELQFGWTIGDRYEEPVLLIKTAWGGRSLWRVSASAPQTPPPWETEFPSILHYQTEFGNEGLNQSYENHIVRSCNLLPAR